ncbi:MAG: pseudouridine synthase, partial [Planctomycetaceae bacterium]|nr:pseudouridine synthase [Planctomycetaceae bacterium]
RSRRECEELITTGRIEIDGQTVTKLGTTVDPASQEVSLDGERLRVEFKKYYMLHKPPGFLCTAKDPAGRPVVLDLFPPDGPRLFTVGRLDENTTGLLIVTNDGDLAQKLAHPRYRIYRLYRAQVAGEPTQETFDELKEGFYFQEGKFRAYDIKRTKKQGHSTWVEITMIEGQNREIRRLFARVGHKVMKLQRIGFGSLRLGRLPVGQYRELRKDELAELHGILHRNQTEAPQRPAKRSSKKSPQKSGRGTKKAASQDRRRTRGEQQESREQRGQPKQQRRRESPSKKTAGRRGVARKGGASKRGRTR